SPHTMIGACPPSSIDRCFTVSALFSISDLPTGVEPVNVIFLTKGLSVNKDPMSLPEPFTALKTFSGTPAAYARSASFVVVRGVSAAGLMMNEQPAASAGSTFLVSIAAGKFHGVIPATRPTGCFLMMMFLFGELAGTVLPYIRLASS